MSQLPHRLQQRLQLRVEEHNLRALPVFDNTSADFVSNDYLGLSRNTAFQQRLLQQVVQNPSMLTSSTGSRLISGTCALVVEVEDYIAAQHQVESALLFNSGYQANVSLFGSLPSARDTILLDEFSHRSMHDGCAISRAKKWKFKHNNLADLERLLQKATGDIYVAVESVYSMDGDIAPLVAIAELTQRYNAYLIVDEAHAIGIYGLGLVHKAKLQHLVFATLVTYGKAMGVHGAAVLAGATVKQAIVNFGSSFIYSTAPSAYAACAIQQAYKYVLQTPDLQAALFANIAYYKTKIQHTLSVTDSPIQLIYLQQLANPMRFAKAIEQANIATYLVQSPTVPLGTERMRICLHQHNTKQEIDNLVTLVQNER